jgi:acetylglutamate kinase
VLDRDAQLISTLTAAEARRLIADGTAHGGMIPKLETCLAALQAGVGAAHILDGRLPHVVLLETFTEAGVGTKIDGA